MSVGVFHTARGHLTQDESHEGDGICVQRIGLLTDPHTGLPQLLLQPLRTGECAGVNALCIIHASHIPAASLPAEINTTVATRLRQFAA